MSDSDFSPKERQKLFIDMSGKEGGVTAEDVYNKAVQSGDTASLEAYYNMGRRLTHKGILCAEKKGRKTFYSQGMGAEGIWLTELEIRELVDPDLPLISLSTLELNSENIRNIRETTWVKIRDILSDINARILFINGIKSIADHVVIVANDRARKEDHRTTRDDERELEEHLGYLKTICKQGLGLSQDAVVCPSVDTVIKNVSKDSAYSLYNSEHLEDEICRRIEDVNFIQPIDPAIYESDDANMLVAAIDGSCRSGMTGYKEPLYDLSVGVAPDVSVQTSVALINKRLKVGKSTRPVFSRLPEKPEDMQQQENKFTVMNRYFHPELTDSEYLHAISCAMDLLEVRATERVMRRWDFQSEYEVPPAEVVMRDGTLVPHDRNYSHYKQDNTYGRIARELIERSWSTASRAEMDGCLLVGLVKRPQVSPVTPIVNWYISQYAAKFKDPDLQGWPQSSLNKLTDQQLLTRILTAGDQDNSLWHRMAVIMRPFYATSSFNTRHRRSADKDIPSIIINEHKEQLESLDDMTDHQRVFVENFRGKNDPFVQMISKTWYAYSYVGSLPRLDLDNALPRLEFSLLQDIREKSDFPEEEIKNKVDVLLTTLVKTGFDVSNEHSMFLDVKRLDIMPKLCIEAHNIAKDWMRDFMVKIKEYISYHSRLFQQTRSPASYDVHGYLKKEEIKSFFENVRNERLMKSSDKSPPRLVNDDDEDEKMVG